MLRDHLDADHFESPAVRERSEVVAAHHAALLVVVYELAQHAGLWELREGAEVDARLGVALTDEGAARPRAEWDEVPWAGEGGRGSVRRGQGSCGECTVVCGDSRRRACVRGK